MYKEQRIAEAKYGTTDVKPQEKDLEFLKYLRRLNSKTGCWINSPAATIEIRESVNRWTVPNKIVDARPSSWINSVEPAIVLIEEEDAFKKMMIHLTNEDVIALDYEHHTKNSYNDKSVTGLIALIQLCGTDKTYIVDPFKLRTLVLEVLCPQVLCNPKIIKILCGGDNDILFTQSNFDCFLQGTMDVQYLYDVFKATSPDLCFSIMGRIFRYYMEEKAKNTEKGITDLMVKDAWAKANKISYAKLVGGFFWDDCILLNKDAQHADFRQRPLTKLGPLLKYAASDVHYLIRVYEKLRGMVSKDDLVQAFEKSNIALKKTFAGIKYPSVEQLIKKKIVIPTHNDLACFTRLHHWRDGYAKTMDESPDNVMSLVGMMDLVKKRDSISSMDMLRKVLEKNKFLAGNQTLHIFAVIKNDQDTFAKMEEVVCHNCDGKGHCGWACPHPLDLEAWGRFFARPENKMFRDRQNFRRAQNWYNKTGVWPSNAPKPDNLPTPKCLR